MAAESDPRMISRRFFLGATAFAAAGTVAGVRGAAAFSVEEAEPPLAAEYLAAREACRSRGEDHGRQLALAVEQLSQRPLTAEEREALIASLSCPVCGCRLSGG